MTLCRLGLLAIVLVFTAACATASPSNSPDEPDGQSPAGFRGEEFVREAQAEYAANKFRAQEKHIGKRVRLEGEISAFHMVMGMGVTVDIGSGAAFGLYQPSPHFEFDWSIPEGLNYIEADAKSAELRREYERLEQEKHEEQLAWEAWFLAGSVGDTIRAECTVKGLTSEGDSSGRVPGTPTFEKCELLEGGD